MSDDIILDVQHVTKEFPGVRALSDVSFQVKRGTIHGIAGENGAGKSTLMKILSGVYPYGTYEGKIVYDGKELKLEAGSIRQARDEGIAIVYQELTLVPSMTVGENIFLGQEPIEGLGINWNKLYADTRSVLGKYNLDIDPQAVVKTLGIGKMQMTEIAKALSEDARILILDEPTSALTENEIDKLMGILANLREQGITCIYITHKLEEFMRITDNLTILRDGKVITTQPTKNLSVEKVVNFMVGREMTERFPKSKRHMGKVIFQVEDLHALDPNNSSREVLRGISFEVRAGEIFGIAGLMGSGRTELVTTIFGEYGKITQGKILLDGREIHPKSSHEAMEEGISLVPEDRKRHGLILIQSILNNMTLPNLYHFGPWYRIDDTAELGAATTFSKNLAVKAPTLQVKVDTLSGGNQQKVVISKWLMTRPKLLIMDDPTRGIDVGAKYEIYKLMDELAEQGMGIIMISSELSEVLGMADRVMVMHEGKSAGTLDISDASEEKIMAHATGIA